MAHMATPIYSARLAERQVNFLTPMLVLGAFGGLHALVVRLGSGDAGMWPLAWLVALFIGVLYSALHSLLAGSRHLSMVYMVGLSSLVGSWVICQGIVYYMLHTAHAAELPHWLHHPQVRSALDSPWSILAPYAAALALHGGTMLTLALRHHTQPRSN